MACGLHEGIQLHFLRSGIRVVPHDVDIRADYRHYAHGQFELSEAAGKVVANNHTPREPVHVLFDDHIAHRFFIPPEAVEFVETFDQKTIAQLDLHDARKVMGFGSFSKKWDVVEVGVAVEEIFNTKDDPESVITDYRFTSDVDLEDLRIGVSDLLEDIVTPLEVDVPVLSDAEDSILDWITDAGLGLVGDSDGKATVDGFNFDGITPLEAMHEVVTEFGYTWWADTTGTLHIGSFGSHGQVVGTVAGNNEFALKRYNVVESANKINRVKAESGYTTLVGVQGIAQREKQLQILAEASAPNVSGSTLHIESEQSQLEPAELERAVANHLYLQIGDDVNGNIVVNGLATENVEGLARLTPGDHILVDDSIESECNKDVLTGHFLVHDVHHRANQRTGWEVTLRVSQTVTPGDIQTKSVIFDPTDGKRYDDLDSISNE